MAKNTRTSKSTAKPSTAKPNQSSRISKSGASSTKEVRGDIATARNTGRSTTKGK